MVPAVVKKKRAFRLTLVAGLLGALLPAAARAHPEVSPQLVNRYLSLIVAGERLEFFVTLLYGALPAAELRKGLDQDGDGRISEPERQRAQGAWQRRAGELATLTVDGVPIRLADATADLQLGPDSSAGAAPLVVEVYGSRPVPQGTRQVRLEPGWDPPRLGETELMLDLSPGWELVASRQGQGPDQQLTRYKLEGPRTAAFQDRSVTFVVRSAPVPARRAPIAGLAAIAGSMAVIGLTLEILRRRREATRPRSGP
jgi:hypothetical protein